MLGSSKRMGDGGNTWRVMERVESCLLEIFFMLPKVQLGFMICCLH